MQPGDLHVSVHVILSEQNPGIFRMRSEAALRALDMRFDNICEHLDAPTRARTRTLRRCFEASLLEARLRLFELAHNPYMESTRAEAHMLAIQALRQGMLETYRQIRAELRPPYQ